MKPTRIASLIQKPIHDDTKYKGASAPLFASHTDADIGDAGWSSPVARQAHNLKVAGSNPAPATKTANSQASTTNENPEARKQKTRGYY